MKNDPGHKRRMRKVRELRKRIKEAEEAEQATKSVKDFHRLLPPVQFVRATSGP